MPKKWREEMRNIFQNKKVLISIIVAVVIIVVAIVLFVVLGTSGKNKKTGDNSTIKFSDDNSTSKDETTNSSNKTGDNKTNSTSSDDIGGDIDEFYKNAVNKFTEAFMDEDAMGKFLDECMDLKAYVAYENIDGDESKFLSEYESIADDDPRIEETKTACLSIPSSYNMMMSIIDAAMQMAKTAQNTTNQSEANVTGNFETSIDMEDITEEDKKLVLKDISEPEQSSDDENITKIKVTYTWMQEDADLYMIFYGDVVIYICDEEGTALTETGLNQGAEWSSGDDETNTDTEE